MALSLFGKQLFVKKKANEETHLYDFSQHGNATTYSINNYIQVADAWVDTPPDPKKTEKPKEKPARSPKEIYRLGMLNQPQLAIRHDAEYISAEQAKLQKKLSLVRGEYGASNYARAELRSMIERLGNRLRLDEFKGVFEEYPHTTTQAITEVANGHSNLLFREASEFIPDFPDDAVAAMDEYRQMCQALCKKDPIFYVLADKADFGEITRRRDPILFAQSPFGFIWQILGAWDDTMIYLGDL